MDRADDTGGINSYVTFVPYTTSYLLACLKYISVLTLRIRLLCFFRKVAIGFVGKWDRSSPLFYNPSMLKRAFKKNLNIYCIRFLCTMCRFKLLHFFIDLLKHIVSLYRNILLLNICIYMSYFTIKKCDNRSEYML